MYAAFAPSGNFWQFRSYKESAIRGIYTQPAFGLRRPTESQDLLKH